MSDPVVVDKKPLAIDLEPGTYWWCSCGQSKNQPFCDGSHSGTDFSPVKLEVEEAGKQWLCQCRHSENQPFCDGAHKKL